MDLNNMKFEQKTLPRGIRNKNPFNICKGPKYEGLREIQLDGRFCQFDEMKYGCRAMWKLLVSYRLRFIGEKKAFSIRNIIWRFAPPNENDTDFYAKRVARIASINIDDTLPDPEKSERPFLDILVAMASIENGWDVEKVKQELLNDIRQGYILAFRAES